MKIVLLNHKSWTSFQIMRFILVSLFCLSTSACKLNSVEESIVSCATDFTQTINIMGGTIRLGTDRAYAEEYFRDANVDDYDIDRLEVTNSQFRTFVEETNYVTTAERPQPGFEISGGAVFKAPTDKNPSWWHFTEGANWRQPEGPGSTIEGKDSDPVVQVSLVDARAYADWAGRAIPSEAQWEHAARGGSETLFVWGNERVPEGIEQANTWQGAFPIENIEKDGFYLRAPVGCFKPNGYGLYDMIGNVWEWTITEYDQTEIENSYTIKGGSFLCAPNYCARYRAPARQSQEGDFSTNHIGFRTVSAPQ